MIILGISAYYHDSAAALIIDGKIVAAASEERFCRIKHYNGFPSKACRWCLNHASLTISEIDEVIFYEKPIIKFERIIRSAIFYAPKSFHIYLKAMQIWLKERLNLRKTICRELKHNFGSAPKKVLFCRHHQAHAAMAYYTSSFDHSAILVIDAVGEETTTSIFKAEGNSIKLIEEQKFPHSLGLLYSSFTYYLGFKVNSDEYKVMGLAPYGNKHSEQTKRFINLIKHQLVIIQDDGALMLNEHYFTFMYGLKMVSEKTWHKLFGIKRRQTSDKIEQVHCNLAYAIQQVTEDIILLMAKHAKDITKEDNLCVSGGCALNCAAIGRLEVSRMFKHVYVPFAPGDDGCAIGAAMSVYGTRKIENRNPYTGPVFSNNDIEKCLKKHGIDYQYIEDFESLCEIVSAELTNQKIVGWFQGKMEFGPRALGNRSILADARSPKMKDLINSKVKFRESFRPFAPVVLQDYASDIFNINGISPYMMSTFKVKNSNRNYPAITHIDGTARIQTVSKSDNDKLYLLLKTFKKETDSPLLLNTSFNVMGEPIVCSPDDAVNTFKKSGLDILVINNYLIKKK